LIAQFPHLAAWEERVKAIGHGKSSELTSTEALEIARRAEPATPEQVDPHDPQSLTGGQTVEVVADVDSGEAPVRGLVHFVSRDTIALLRDDPIVGRVCVHFPRAGYRTTPLG
jgi:hypothetical protein